MERKTRKHRQYSINEKNKIVKKYLNGESAGIVTIAKQCDVSKSTVERWIKQYREFGTTVDRRGQGTAIEVPNKGRQKKSTKFEDMSKEELLEYINMSEDIKKAFAYLEQQKKNTK